MEHQQYEQIQLYHQIDIINEQIKSLPLESKIIIENAIGDICSIEMVWGILCSIDIAKRNNKINKADALDLIKWLEDNSSPVHISEMKKDLMFIKEGENNNE